jgi:uncharacterized protein YceK
MNASVFVRIAVMTLTVASMLCLSGCLALGSRGPCCRGEKWHDDPQPYSGVRLGVGHAIERLLEDDVTAADKACVTILVIVDFPLTFAVDTVLLPVDLVAMSRDPAYHGQVLHGVTGEPVRDVEVLASPLVEDLWAPENLRAVYAHGRTGLSIDRSACHATRTDEQGRFAFRLHGKSLHDLKGFVVLEEGYSLVWRDRPCISKGERRIDMPALRLHPEGASGGAP